MRKTELIPLARLCRSHLIFQDIQPSVSAVIAVMEPQFLEEHLLFGALPGIYLQEKREDRELDLRSYVEIYLEQEIRQEALTRNLGAFSRFLELAALEAGQVLNYSKIAQDVGVSVNTLKSYFEVLFDTLVAERVS